MPHSGSPLYTFALHELEAPDDKVIVFLTALGFLQLRRPQPMSCYLTDDSECGEARLVVATQMVILRQACVGRERDGGMAYVVRSDARIPRLYDSELHIDKMWG
jgi:hypothetical protein